MRPQLAFWQRATVAVAVAGALALPALPAAASARTVSASHQVTNSALAACHTSRPHTGTILQSEIRGGLGQMVIKNHLSRDAVIELVRGKSKAVGVYVRAHATTTVRNIKPGWYTVYFTSGSLFKACTGRFTSGAAYYRVKKHLYFDFPPHYDIWTLTLVFVKGGNAPTSPIPPKSFPAP